MEVGTTKRSVRLVVPNMIITLKLKTIGKGVGVVIPKKFLKGKVGDNVDIDILDPVILAEGKVVNPDWCYRHQVYRGQCGCVYGK